MSSKWKQFGLFGALLFGCVLSMTGMQASAQVPADLTPEQARLIRAIRFDDFDRVKHLLEDGLNPNYEVKKGSTTPLIEAIAEREPKAIALLLDHGADVNFGVKDGMVPLGVAAWYNESDVVNLLIQRGANLDARDDEGYTPLLEAASHAQGLEVIKSLIAAGADIKATTSEEGETALMLAAWNLNTDAVRLFIDLGLDPCAKSGQGETALDMAQIKIVKLEARKELLQLLRNKCPLATDLARR